MTQAPEPGHGRCLSLSLQPDSTPQSRKCLLSLDGGGFRGLSTLLILKIIMDKLNNKRISFGLPRKRPCEIFHLVGGTNTGGLIAIMLGRLEMDADQCIAAYTKLATGVFGKKLSSIPFNVKGDTKPQFDSKELLAEIQRVLSERKIPENALFVSDGDQTCKTFVCAMDQGISSIVHLRSYTLESEISIGVRPTICQAALATLATIGFFKPIEIGERRFSGGEFGANNPVEEVEAEATDIWCTESRELKPLIKCFVSIGAGSLGLNPLEDNLMKFYRQTMTGIAAETDRTARKFADRWRKELDLKRYFRFHVEQGLQKIAAEDCNNQGAIEAATEHYLNSASLKLLVRDCIDSLESISFEEGHHLLVMQTESAKMMARQSSHQLETHMIFDTGSLIKALFRILSLIPIYGSGTATSALTISINTKLSYLEQHIQENKRVKSQVEDEMNNSKSIVSLVEGMEERIKHDLEVSERRAKILSLKLEEAEVRNSLQGMRLEEAEQRIARQNATFELHKQEYTELQRQVSVLQSERELLQYENGKLATNHKQMEERVAQLEEKHKEVERICAEQQKKSIVKIIWEWITWLSNCGN